MFYRQTLVSLPLIALCESVFAQGPLNIEQLIVDRSSMQVSSAADFRKRLLPGGTVEESVVTTALRYGLAPGVEINGSVAVGASEESRQRAQPHSWSLGANWQALPEGRTPGLVLEGRIDVRASTVGVNRSFPGGALAATVYRSIDPIVLSLSSIYTFSRSFTVEDVVVQPGHVFRIEPMVNFAVNPEITLFGGLAVQAREATTLAGEAVSESVRDVFMRGGVGWSPSRHSTFFITGEFSSGNGGSGAGIQWLYQL